MLVARAGARPAPGSAVAGFAAGTVTEETTEDRPPRELFVGRRPKSS